MKKIVIDTFVEQGIFFFFSSMKFNSSGFEYVIIDLRLGKLLLAFGKVQMYYINMTSSWDLSVFTWGNIVFYLIEPYTYLYLIYCLFEMI